MSSRPNEVTSGGTDTKSSERPRAKRTRALRRLPVMMPAGIPIAVASSSAAAPSSAVFLARSATSSPTGRRYFSDSPRSRRTARPSHAPYRTTKWAVKTKPMSLGGGAHGIEVETGEMIARCRLDQDEGGGRDDEDQHDRQQHAAKQVGQKAAFHIWLFGAFTAWLQRAYRPPREAEESEGPASD